MTTSLRSFVLALCAIVFVGCTTDQASADCVNYSSPTNDWSDVSVYMIGNSLTNDTYPENIDGKVEWHIDCNTNLLDVYENPINPCKASSHIWPNALSDKNFDFITVQPHYGTKLDQDVRIISGWLINHVNAVLVVHTGWARATTMSQISEFNEMSKEMSHSQVYFDSLVDHLCRENPGLQIRIANSMSVLSSISSDIEQGLAPFDDLAELYRDGIHMTLGLGRYLMHNVMRSSLGQPLSDKGFTELPSDKKKYIDKKLNEYIQQQNLL